MIEACITTQRVHTNYQEGNGNDYEPNSINTMYYAIERHFTGTGVQISTENYCFVFPAPGC